MNFVEKRNTMRKLALKMSLSADGFVAGPNGEAEWIFKTSDEGSTNYLLNMLDHVGLHIMGRKTFNDMSAHWPTSSEALAKPMNGIPKAVFTKHPELVFNGPTSQSLKDAQRHNEEAGLKKVLSPHADTWKHPIIASGDLAEEIRKLKSMEGKDMMAYGGASFAQQLVKQQLIDEYHLFVHPVAIGKGLPLFSQLTGPRYLKLVRSVTFDSGIVANSYVPA